MKFSGIRVGARLAIGFSILIVMLAAVVVISVLRLTVLNGEIDNLIQDKFPKTVLTSGIINNMHVIGRAARNMLLTKDARTEREMLATIREAKSENEQRFVKLDSLITTPGGKKLLAKAEQKRQAFNSATDVLVGLADSTSPQYNVEKAKQYLFEYYRVANNDYQKSIEALEDYQTELMDRAGEATRAEAEKTIILILSISAAAAIVSVLFALFITRSITRQLGGEPGDVSQVMARMAQGDLSARLAIPADDRQSMAYSINVVIDALARLATLANAIGRGEFTQEVPLLSEEDLLGTAIRNMNDMLRTAQRDSDQRNWLKDGLTQLSHGLTGDQTPQHLAEQAISEVSRYLAAGRGVLYVWRAEEQALELLGSYMHTERQRVGARFALGEGAVGQVAREGKPIVLEIGRHDDVEPITTGTFSVAPCLTYTWPLLREGTLQGVLEIASGKRLSELEQDYLEQATQVIASFLFTVLQRQRINELLVVAEESARQAQEKSNQVQAANALLEEQQQQLQQQTEELQLSNAQLEEQQQQLQQQSEELQQTNAHLEEQRGQMERQAEELAVKNKELKRSRDEIDQRARELEVTSRYKSEFLANMSHELRTPLNSIILLSKMLAMNEDSHLSEDEVKRASIVHRAGEELLRLINDILDLSKIESGKMDLHVQGIASSSLLDEFRDLFSATAHDKGLAFILEDQWQGEFCSDRDKLSQVVRNLLSNAFKFTKQGNVTLRLARDEGAALPVIITVSDTGIGIPEGKLQQVFEAFQQVDGSISREYGGTGLGLTISRRFVELLGGTIELHSVLGEGSVFTLRLPLTPVEGETVAPPPGPSVKAASVLTSPPSGRAAVGQVSDDRTNLKSSDQVILLVDDDPAFGEAMVVLNKRLGYKTLVAATGQEGLRMAKAYRPRGILLDLGLPDMDGSEVLHGLKTDRELRHLPVYIVSARDRGEVALQDQVAGYLQKPVNESQLADAEADVLARAVRTESGLLLLEGDRLTRDKLAAMLGPRPVSISTVSDVAGAVAALNEDAWSLVVVDLAVARTVPGGGAGVCAALRAAAPDVGLILYSAEPLGAAEEGALRPYTDSIIVPTVQAEQRLQGNIERFLKGAPFAGGPVKPLAGAGSEEKRLVGMRILVVDDDARNLFVITAALEQHGAQVETALGGGKALELLHQQAFDLVFMDIMMPDMDGYSVIRAMRADAALKAIPVVALTAKALKADREKALSAGADDYLSKPVDYEVLVNMARVWGEARPR